MSALYGSVAREAGWSTWFRLVAPKLLWHVSPLQWVFFALGRTAYAARMFLVRLRRGDTAALEERSRAFRIYQAPRRVLDGMTTRQEQAFLEHYGREVYAGDGALVDLGSFLGSSIIPLARGLDGNPRARAAPHRIHAYDRFVWEPWMAGPASGTALEGRYRVGESFLPGFLEHVAPWRERIEVHEGDLNRVGWSGGPIEFLFIDAMKTWDLANAITASFFPHLLPGALVVHQDFAHAHTPWIHLWMHRLGRYFEPVEHVPHSPSMVFRYRGGAPEERLRSPLSFAAFDAAEIDAAFAASLAMVRDEMRWNVAAAKVMCFVYRGDEAEAAREYGRQREAGIVEALEFAELRDRLFSGPTP